MAWTSPVCVLLLLVLPRMLGAPREAVQGLQCHDWQGNPVVDGVKYIPKKEDPCTACVCDDGFPVMCTAVLCSPPECHLWEAVEGECCRFHCIEPDHAPSNKTKDTVIPRNTKSNEVDKTNLGLRLIASTVTSFLILALLIFMVHRLRQRRMLIMMRRMHADRRDEEAVAYMSQFDQVDMGIEFPPYEEPPPPYTPPKPSDIPHGEAPPPYEVTPGGENSNETNNNTGGGSLPGGGRGPRPLQGTGGGILPAVSRYSYSSVDPSSTLDESPPGYRTSQHHSHHHLASPQEERPSLSISRSAREIQAHSEALTPPGGAASMAGGLVQSPSEHEYENLRSVCMRQFLLQREPSSEAETASAMSTPPDFSPDMDYPSPSMGAPATPAAMTMSFHSQGAPASQVMVRMHNDNPRSHLVRAGEQLTSSTPAGLGAEPQVARPLHEQLLNDDHRPWVPSYRTQFIKRSESVEIKCGSSSPRNSFHPEDTTDGAPTKAVDGGEYPANGAVAGSPGGSSGSSSPSNDHPAWPKKKRPLAPNVTWNKSCRPFRIRLDSTSPVGGDTEQEGAVAGGAWGTRQEPRAIRHSTYGTGMTSSPSPPSVSVHRHSLPPIDLDLPDPVDAILGASGTKYYKTGGAGCSGTSTDPSPADGRLEVGVSPTGSGQVTGSSESSSQSPVNPVVKGQPKSHSVSPSTPSPKSPVGQCMVRSGSVTSQVSQFSVCSETGEKKRPRPNIPFPRSIRNDAHYPLSPLSSNYAAPMNSVPPVLKPKKQSPTSPLAADPIPSASGTPRQANSPPRQQSSVSSESQPSATSPPEREHYPQAAAVNLNEDQPSSGRRIQKHAARRNKISYVDVSPEREKSSSSASTPTTSSDSSGGYPKQPTSPLTNDSTMSSLSPLSPDSGGGFDNQNSMSIELGHAAPVVSPEGQDAERPDRGTVRKVKKQSQRRRRPRSTPDAAAAAAAVDASKASAATPASHSPERHRRLSRNVDTSTTFKQYGFIDDPDVINNAREITLGHNNGSLPRNHNLRRQHSREKSSRDNSCEKRDNSCERKRDNSRERQRSRERRGSRGERRERSHERKKDKSSRSHSRERVQRDCPDPERSGANGSAGETTGRTQNVSTVTPEEEMTNGLSGPPLDNLTPSTRVEGRKREREQAAQAASLERRKKRRSTGERLLAESSQNNNYPVTLTNGHVYPPTTTTNTNGQGLTNNGLHLDHQNEADLVPIHRARRGKNNRTHENRHSIPLIVHRNR